MALERRAALTRLNVCNRGMATATVDRVRPVKRSMSQTANFRSHDGPNLNSAYRHFVRRVDWIPGPPALPYAWIAASIWLLAMTNQGCSLL